VGLALASLEAIERDQDLSSEWKRRKKQQFAKQTLDQLAQPASLKQARDEVASIQAKWQAKIDAVLLKPKPEDAATATLFWETRDKFASLKPEQRLSWLERFGNDPLVPSALLHGPAGLTNLSEAERALLRNKVEAHVEPEIIAAKAKVTKAMAELERGYRAGRAMVAQGAGLQKGPEGEWPSHGKAA
jgi:hypothetical protein